MTNLVQLAQTALTYSNLAVQLMVGDANFYAEKLELKESLPIQTSNLVVCRVDGRQLAVSGVIWTTNYRYDFKRGQLYKLSRSDLFESTNSIAFNSQKLIRDDELKKLSMLYLGALNFDTNAVARRYRAQVHNAPWGADGYDYTGLDHRARYVTPSLSKPIAMVEWTPAPGKNEDREELGRASVYMLATTGECIGLDQWANPGESNLTVRRHSKLEIAKASDVSAPRFYSGGALTTEYKKSLETDEVRRLVRDAHSQMRQRLGTNEAKVFLVDDNLNAPEVVAEELNILLRDAPYAGQSTRWRDDLPFTGEKLKAVSQGLRGFQILAVSGDIETEVIARPMSAAPPYDRSMPHDSRHKREAAPAAAKFSSELAGVFHFPKEQRQLLLVYPDSDMAGLRLSQNVLSRMTATSVTIIQAGQRHTRLSGSTVFTYGDGMVMSNHHCMVRLSGHFHYLGSELNYGLADCSTLLPLLSLPRFLANPLEQVTDELGVSLIEAMRRAERVEAIRITTDIGKKRPRAKPIDNYKLLGYGRKQGNAFARALAEVLVNENDQFEANKMCIFDPGVMFRLWSGKQCVKVTICFHCNDVAMELIDEEGKAITETGCDFGKNRAALLNLCRKAFPSDQELAKLKLER